MWLYQNGILHKLIWPFTIYDFSITLTKGWDRRTGVYLKKWAGIFRNADVGILFRLRSSFGLQLTPPSLFFKKMQLIKSHILKHSSDPSIRALYNTRSSRESSFRHKNRGSHFLSHIEPIVDHTLKFQGQINRQGLGHGRYIKPKNTKEHRALLVDALIGEDTTIRLSHSHTLALQGVWTHWISYVEPFDLSWNNIIYNIHPKLLSFMLNAMINSLPTPDLLKLWKIRGDSACYLCNKTPCTLHHILTHCPTALNGHRYNWRHDSVLKTLQPVLLKYITNYNENHSSTHSSFTPTHFLRTGDKHKATRPPRRSSLLDGATDWKLLIDFDSSPILFPPEIVSTNQRPDIVIWSIKIKQVIIFELTCGGEEGIPCAVRRKWKRYADLVQHIKDKKWRCFFRTMEVGARGLVAHSTRHCLSRLGFSYANATRICKQLSLVSARCSYAIWLSRKLPSWDKHRALISVDIPVTQPRHTYQTSKQRALALLSTLTTSTTTSTTSSTTTVSSPSPDSDSDDQQPLTARYAVLKRMRSCASTTTSIPITKITTTTTVNIATTTTISTSTTMSSSIDDMAVMPDIDLDDLNEILHKCGIPSDIPPDNTSRDHDSHAVVLDPDEEEKNRGFNSDEENMLAEFDDDWG